MCLLGLLLAIAGGTARGSAAISEVVRKVTRGRVTVNFDDVKDWGVMIHDTIESATNTIESATITDWGVNYDINEHSMFEHSHKIYKGDVPKYCLGDDVADLDIEVGGCILETKTSKDNSFYVEVTKAYKFQGYVEDATLYIKASNGAQTWNKMGSCTITLYVPRDFWFEDVDIEMGAGVLEFSDLLASDCISLEVGAGQIVIDNICSNELELEIGAGEIVLKNMDVYKELSAEVGMGNFEANAVVMGDAEIQCSMGNVNLELAGSEQNYNYNIECAMGNIDLGNRSYSGLAREMSINNNAGVTVDIQCAMGNVSVSFMGSQTTYVTGDVVEQEQW